MSSQVVRVKCVYIQSVNVIIRGFLLRGPEPFSGNSMMLLTSGNSEIMTFRLVRLGGICAHGFCPLKGFQMCFASCQTYFCGLQGKDVPLKPHCAQMAITMLWHCKL